MLKMLWVVLFILLVTTILGANLSSGQNEVCSNDNPFIKKLDSQGVQLLQKPTKVSSTCAFEFSSFGTCCNQGQLVQHAETETKNLMADVHYINQEYLRFQGVLARAYKMLKRTAMA